MPDGFRVLVVRVELRAESSPTRGEIVKDRCTDGWGVVCGARYFDSQQLLCAHLSGSYVKDSHAQR